MIRLDNRDPPLSPSDETHRPARKQTSPVVLSVGRPVEEARRIMGRDAHQARAFATPLKYVLRTRQHEGNPPPRQPAQE